MSTTLIGQASGTVEAAGDNDWFQVTLQAGTQYVFDVGGGTLSTPQVSLYDSSGHLIASGTSGGPAGYAETSFEPTVAGTYYIGASASDASTGTYSVHLSTAPFDYAGNTSTTGTVSVGGQASGTLSAAGQNDWFKVNLTAGTQYTFNVSSSALGAAQVTLYDSTGKEILNGNDGGTLAGTAAAFGPTASGSYYVGVSDTAGGTGSFTLSVNTANFDFAGNATTTGTVAVGGQASGTISAVGQADWFKVDLTAGTQYVFDVGGGTVTPSVYLYDGSGNLLAEGFNGGANGGARTSFEPTASGTYYVAAAGFLSTTGTYTVSVSTAPFDVAGNTTTTGTVSVGGHVTGTLGVVGQSEWYKVQLNSGSEYVFDLGGGTLTNPDVALYDASGHLLVSGTTGGSNGGARTSYEPTSSGTYYVAASGQASISTPGTFTLSVSTAPFDHAGNTTTTATVTVGGQATGTLATVGQSDWFKVQLTAGTSYEFNVGNGTLATPEVSLYDSSGHLLASGTGGGANGAAQTSFSPATSGTYYVAASSTGSDTGTFTVSAATYTDDYLGNTATTGRLMQVFTAATAIADYQQGQLTQPGIVMDSAANVQSSLDGLEALASAGLLHTITLTDASTPTITVSATQMAQDQKAIEAISSGYTLSVNGYSSSVAQFIAQQSDHYLPGTSHPGSDQVVGFQTADFGSGYGAVVLDGPRSQYTLQIDANDVANITDTTSHQTVTVTGANYLLFDGAAQNSDSYHSYQSLYFVEGTTNAQIASLYNAAFLRQPDLQGLEFYATPIANNTMSLHQAAVYFLASPEFQNLYPTATAPADHGGPNDQAFVDTIYQNVLHRTPSASDVAWYMEALAGTLPGLSAPVDRAQILIYFAVSPENQADIGNWMINLSQGGYADPGALLPASTVLPQADHNNYLNTALIDPTTIGNGVTSTDYQATASGGSASVTVLPTAPAQTVMMSTSFPSVTVQDSGSSIHSSTVNDTITVDGGANTSIFLGSTGMHALNLLGGTSSTVYGFTPDTGSTLGVADSAVLGANVQLLDGTTTPVDGSQLNFGGGTVYVVNIGNIGNGSAASVAAAANHAYLVADINGTGAAPTATGEFITFMGQDSSGNTEFWFFGSTAGASHGQVPATSLVNTADTNANHLVDASEITHVATVVGVAPTSLVTADLA